MKRCVFVACMFVLPTATLPLSSRSQEAALPVLKGPYLGQKPPGMTPEVFAPGIVSTDSCREFSGTFSPDGKEYYFFRFGASTEMMVSRLTDGQWSMPQPTSFNTQYIDNEPHITPDGNCLFFCSNRPYPGCGETRIPTQVWLMRRAGGSWGEPRHLLEGMAPTASNKGQLCIGSYAYRLVGDSLVSIGKLEYDSAVSQEERLPRQHTCIAWDESFHVFDFKQTLYVSFRTTSGLWGRPINMTGKLDVSGGALLPTLSPDGKYLFFCNRGDIYWVSAKIIEELRPEKSE